MRGTSGLLAFLGPPDGGKLRLGLGSPLEPPPAGPDEQWIGGGGTKGRGSCKGVLARVIESIYDHVKQVFLSPPALALVLVHDVDLCSPSKRSRAPLTHSN